MHGQKIFHETSSNNWQTDIKTYERESLRAIKKSEKQLYWYKNEWKVIRFDSMMVVIFCSRLIYGVYSFRWFFFCSTHFSPMLLLLAVEEHNFHPFFFLFFGNSFCTANGSYRLLCLSGTHTIHHEITIQTHFFSLSFVVEMAIQCERDSHWSSSRLDCGFLHRILCNAAPIMCCCFVMPMPIESQIRLILFIRCVLLENI